MKIKTIGTIFLTAILLGCQKRDVLQDTLREAAGNSAELQSVIDSYSGEKKEIAEYTVMAVWGHRSRTSPGIDSVESLYRELPGAFVWQLDSQQLVKGLQYTSMLIVESKDAKELTAEYLKSNIDEAYTLWRSRRWNQNLPKDLFYEMILPYRIGDEPLTEWRSSYRSWLSELEDTISKCANSVDAAHIIASYIGVCPYNDQLQTPHRTALNLLNTPIGYCREDCDRTVYAMRAMGVPVAIDMMLVSPENGAAHSWVVVWDNADMINRMFDNGRYLPTRDSTHYDQRRKGKIYRQTFAPDFDRLKRYKSVKNVPKALLNPWLKDVTSEYFGHNKAVVEVWPEVVGEKEKSVYLGVFARQHFQPIDIANLYGNNAVFTDIEPNLIYAPIKADGKVCGYPFLLDENGKVRYVIGDESRMDTVKLTRKFPLRFIHRERMASVIGLHVQSGPTASGPWQDIEIIKTSPEHSYRRIAIERLPHGPYLRLFKPTGVTALIDQIIACRDTLGLDLLPLSVIGHPNRFERILKANYTVTVFPGVEDCIVHINTNEPISSLFILPSNDDNFVVPAQEYELRYFAGREGWKTLKRKVSEGFSIEFEAPHGALMWLRNLSKGKEEQVFIYRDSRQLFNIDL